MTKLEEIRQRSDPFTNAKKAAEVALKKIQPYQKNHPTYMRALDAVSNWVATRCLPIQVACSDEFHAVMQTLDTKMPKIRQEEVRSCILQHYEDAKVNLKAICPMRVATTIDFWSRLDRKGFGTVTVHFITKNWELQEKVLGAKSLDAMIGIDEDDTDFQIPHETAENIGQFYCGMLERVGLKPHTNTTDAPSVMELFRHSIVDVIGLHCLSHVLHNAIKKAYEVVLIKSDVDKLRNLCTEIMNSSILSGQLAANLAKVLVKGRLKLFWTVSGDGGIPER